MSELLSHPHQTLQTHIHDVVKATEWALNNHSNILFDKNPMLHGLTMRAVDAHDLGKGSNAFQEYIRNPKGFRGAPIEKAHSPLSMLLVLRLAQQEDWAALDTLSVAAAVAGHHSGMPLADDLPGLLLDTIPSYVWKNQLTGLPIPELAIHTGLPVQDLSLSSDIIPEADYLEYDLLETLNELSLLDALKLRLNTQFALSLLLEADKTFLAVDKEYRKRLQIPREIDILSSCVDVHLSGKPESPLNIRRTKVRQEVLAATDLQMEAGIHTVTLPTGMGKTMVAASWALKLRNMLKKDNHFSKVVIVLPYLSIIDQTVQEYRELLGDLGTPDVLLQMHSISDRVFDPEMDGGSNDFFIDTWQSPFVITTFDQFLLALFGPRAKHLMRYHNLYDALIVMDEVQTLPCKLWDSVNHLFQTMTQVGNARFLVMSATQPGFLTNATELVANPKKEFANFQRYQLVLKHGNKQPLEDFTSSIIDQLSEFEDKRVLITLNTRRSARYVRDALEEECVAPLFFISADVTPKDRLVSIQKIKEGKPCIVVSTQCVEAGVDIDMDLVIRDIAPFDAMVQIAGRCNRNDKKPRCDVEIVSLANEIGQDFARMIYDEYSLQETHKVLDKQETIREEEIYELCSTYFNALGKRDTGKDITENFAYWREIPSVRELLRGKEREKYEFIVAKEDPGLIEAIAEAHNIEDRWEKRRAIRNLAGRIGRVTVSVYAKRGWEPEDFADACGPFWILRDEYYQSDRGLVLPESETEYTGAMIL